MYRTIIYATDKSDWTIICSYVGASVNDGSTVTTGISSSRNRLSKHGKDSPFIKNRLSYFFYKYIPRMHKYNKE